MTVAGVFVLVHGDRKESPWGSLVLGPLILPITDLQQSSSNAEAWSYDYQALWSFAAAISQLMP